MQLLNIGEAKNQSENDDQLLAKDAIVDYEQRQLDYNDLRLDQNENVDNLLNVLNDIIHPAYMNDILFGGAENLSDCF